MESDETAKPATVWRASSRSYYTRSKRQTRAKVNIDKLKLQVERNKVAVEKGKLNLERIKHERARWWQEDNLVDQRLRWLLASHALIVASYLYIRRRIADILMLDPNSCDSLFWNDHTSLVLDDLVRLVHGIPIFAILLCLVVSTGVGAAILAQRNLQEEFDKSDLCKDAPIRLGVTKITTNMGRAVSLFTVALFFLGWGASFTLSALSLDAIQAHRDAAASWRAYVRSDGFTHRTSCSDTKESCESNLDAWTTALELRQHLSNRGITFPSANQCHSESHASGGI